MPDELMGRVEQRLAWVRGVATGASSIENAPPGADWYEADVSSLLARLRSSEDELDRMERNEMAALDVLHDAQLTPIAGFAQTFRDLLARLARAEQERDEAAAQRKRMGFALAISMERTAELENRLFGEAAPVVGEPESPIPQGAETS